MMGLAQWINRDLTPQQLHNSQGLAAMLMGAGGLLKGQDISPIMGNLMEQRQQKEQAKQQAEAQGLVSGFFGGMAPGGSYSTSTAPAAPIKRDPLDPQQIGNDTMAALGIVPEGWDRIKAGIFAGESGGDYNALYGYSNRAGGQFAGTNLTDMTVDQAIAFSDPSGPYGQWVKGQVGRVATPMGAYQIVGSTLRAAKEGLGLKGDEKLTPAMQDKLGMWIYRQQGTGAWEGYQGPRDPGTVSTSSYTPAQGGGPTIDPQRALAIINHPGASPQVKQMFTQMLMESMKPQQPELTSGMREYELARAQGFNGSYLDYQTQLAEARRAQNTVNVSTGNPNELAGLNKLPAGYTYLYDQNGQVRRDQRGVPMVAPLPGTEEAQTREEAAQKKGLADEQAARQADVVLDTIKEIRGITEKTSWFDLPETGVIGDRLGRWGINQEAVDVRNKVNTLEAAIGFDRLDAMRAASPTGGALGQVTERELALLSATLGSLKTSTSPEQFEKTLQRVERQYSEIMRKFSAYPNAGEFLGGGSADDPLGLR